MSKPNKVNKTNYVQGGRLTPDDMARERRKQSLASGSLQAEKPARGASKERVSGKGVGRGATRPRSAREE